MFSLKVPQNWGKHDYQRLRKRKYILFAKDDLLKNKTSPSRAIFLDSILSPPRVLSVLFTAASVLPFLFYVRESAVRPAVMKEGSLSRARIRKSLQRKRNIFILKGIPSRVNSTTRTCRVSSFASYDRQQTWYIPQARSRLYDTGGMKLNRTCNRLHSILLYIYHIPQAMQCEKIMPNQPREFISTHTHTWMQFQDRSFFFYSQAAHCTRECISWGTQNSVVTRLQKAKAFVYPSIQTRFCSFGK